MQQALKVCYSLHTCVFLTLCSSTQTHQVQVVKARIQGQEECPYPQVQWAPHSGWLVPHSFLGGVVDMHGAQPKSTWIARHALLGGDPFIMFSIFYFQECLGSEKQRTFMLAGTGKHNIALAVFWLFLFHLLVCLQVATCKTCKSQAFRPQVLGIINHQRGLEISLCIWKLFHSLQITFNFIWSSKQPWNEKNKNWGTGRECEKSTRKQALKGRLAGTTAQVFSLRFCPLGQAWSLTDNMPVKRSVSLLGIFRLYSKILPPASC